MIIDMDNYTGSGNVRFNNNIFHANSRFGIRAYKSGNPIDGIYINNNEFITTNSYNQPSFKILHFQNTINVGIQNNWFHNINYDNVGNGDTGIISCSGQEYSSVLIESNQFNDINIDGHGSIIELTQGGSGLVSNNILSNISYDNVSFHTHNQYQLHIHYQCIL